MLLTTRQNRDFMPTLLSNLFDGEFPQFQTASFTPKTNLSQTEKEYRVELSVPGLTKEDLSITLEDNNQLVVSMEKKEEKNEENKERTYTRREFSTQSFRQVFVLPEDIHKEQIKAQVEKGVLTIDIPRFTNEDKKKLVRNIEIA